MSDGTHCVKRRRQKITEFLAKHPAIGLFPCRQRVLLGETKEGAGIAGGLGLAIYPNLDGVPETFQIRRDDAPAAGTGVGLGLAIGRGFTEAMGGTLTAEETPGGGATLVVRLAAADGER